MRSSPSIVPEHDDRDIYLVLDNFGSLGRDWREIDEERTDRETMISDLIAGQYSNPARIIAFNTAEGWSRDVSEEIAEEIAARLAHDDRDTPARIEAVYRAAPFDASGSIALNRTMKVAERSAAFFVPT